MQTDKASVLGDAIKYMKQLQEKVATLEEQAAKKATESVIFVKKTQIYADDETSSSDENFDSNQTNNKLFPEIEARVSDKDVLIRIHCEKNKGFISNIMNEVEKLHLCVLNTNVLPFGQATLDITIVAQVIIIINLVTLVPPFFFKKKPLTYLDFKILCRWKLSFQ